MSANLSLFITPEEFVEWLHELESRKLQVIQFVEKPLPSYFRWGAGPLDVIPTGEAVDFVFLARNVEGLNSFQGAMPLPANWGWVLCSRVPRFSADVLYLTEMGAKSEWVESESKSRTKNPESTALLQMIRKDAKARFNGSVECFNVVFGGKSSARGLLISAEARKLYQQGVRLKQQGVANIEFQPAPL